MEITINAQTIISFAALLAAVGTLIAIFSKGYEFVRRQKQQDKDISEIKGEQKILTVGVLACLKGLKEQGCDGPVTDAINQIEGYLNEQAHRTEN